MSRGFLKVYICALPDVPVGGALGCPQRMEYVLSASNDAVRRERYYVWRLLEQAARDTLGTDISCAQYRRLESGEWVCDDFCFSLSHGGGALAVAISDVAVGVDIEPVRLPRAESFSLRVLSATELAEYNALPEGERVRFLIKKWTEKESAFKRQRAFKFIPSAIQTADAPVTTEIVWLEGREYSLSVCSDRVAELEVCNVDFTYLQEPRA